MRKKGKGVFKVKLNTRDHSCIQHYTKPSKNAFVYET